MPRAHKHYGRTISSRATMQVVLCALFSLGVSAQTTPPAPKVGGNGTFETAPPASGLDASTARRRITPLASVPEDFSTLKLAPGFLLAMDVYDTPEYSFELRIDAQGYVNVPTIGKVHVADLTLVEAAQKLSAALRDAKILNDPHVNLNVEEYVGRDVTILGEVHTPGRVEMLAPRRLDEVIAMAGGETDFAGKTIEIRRKEGTDTQNFVIHYSRNTDNKVLGETVVQPGDTVTVRRAGVVYVLGGVVRPGGYIMQEDGDLDVTQALALAYGTTLPAAVGSMRLIRKKDDGQVEEISIPYRDMVKGKVPPMRLQAQDVIYVPLSKIKVALASGLVSTGVTAAVIYGR